jgi:hypothetical protein
MLKISTLRGYVRRCGTDIFYLIRLSSLNSLSGRAILLVQWVGVLVRCSSHLGSKRSLLENPLMVVSVRHDRLVAECLRAECV